MLERKISIEKHPLAFPRQLAGTVKTTLEIENLTLTKENSRGLSTYNNNGLVLVYTT